MVAIEVLAQREAQAEQAKGKADMAWRTAWWETTYALGSVSGRGVIGDAVAVVAETTGQSLAWVRQRRQCGVAFLTLGSKELPPRMACAVAQTPGIDVTADLVAQMIQAEKDGIGLREFTAALTGNAWSDTPEGASVETIKKIVEAQPEVVGRAVAHNDEAEKAYDRASVDRRLAPHGMKASDFREVANPTPAYERMTLNIAGEIRTVLTLIGDLRDNGQVELADHARARLRDVLIDGTARCETIPDTAEGLAP